MKRITLALAFILGLSAGGCEAPFAPADATRITPPPAYRQWWDAVRPCVHKPEVRRFEQVEWYVTPDLPVTDDGQAVWALTRGRQVYLWTVIDSTDWVIQHELVHAINGITGHPYDPFGRCRLMPDQHI